MPSVRVLALSLVGLLGCSSGGSGLSGAASSGMGGMSGTGGVHGSGGGHGVGGAHGSGGAASVTSTSTGAPDAGPGDAAPGDAADAGPPIVGVPAIPCTDTIANVSVTPTNLPPMTPATRGDVVRCAFDSNLSLADVGAAVKAKGISTPMKTAVSLYRIEFRTERGDGSEGASTARVYLPSAPALLPLPVITIGHPTDGIAQSCAPSQDSTSNEDLALPWAGLGYVVIVPDYAGLGNGGTQSYLDNRDQAYSVLDGARALRKLLPAAALSQSVLAFGWSQGGGAVLSAQALARSYGCDGTLAGVVAFAPEWPTRLNSFGFVDQLNNPSELTIQTGISENVVTVMREYAYFYNHVGPSHAGDGFPASARTGIDNAVTSLCQTPLGGYLQATAPHVGDIFDPTFSATMLACIGGADAGAGDAGAADGGPGCVDPGLSYYQFLTNNILAADLHGPPMLYVQGLADIIMPPASEAACNLDKLAKDGVFPQLCIDPLALHTNVVGRNMDFVIAWVQALLAGQPFPTTCPSTGMPTCTP